ncbi:type I-E CRISPR-associated protein Cas6/Cse3/CasE [Yinghuangia aomiensis]
MTGLWLTQIIPDPRHRNARRDIDSAVGLHHRVMSLFPDDLGSSARLAAGVLFRLDDTPDGYRILLQSALEPDLTRLPADYGITATRPLAPLLERLRPGQRVHFRLTANATRKLGATSTAGRPRQIVPLHGADADAWLCRKAEDAGLHITTVHSTALGDARGERGSDKHRVTHARTRFDGLATVRDPGHVVQLLSNGVGRGKAYGCGLLTLAPAP